MTALVIELRFRPNDSKWKMVMNYGDAYLPI